MSAAPATKETVLRSLGDSAGQLLDIRPIDAFNGWPLQDEVRGGHIPGANNIPYSWTLFMDWVEVIEQKKLDPLRPVIIYGYDPNQASRMASKLEKLGFEDVGVYGGFIDEWSPDPDLPLDRLPRFEMLVPPSRVHDLISETNAPAGSGSPVICHANFDYREDYDKGHIPGAVSLNTNWLEHPETWNRRSPAEIEQVLCNLGIRFDTTVVLYGRFSNPSYEQARPAQSAGHLAAMRCAAILLYAGVEHVQIINGGMNAWEQEGLPVSIDSTPSVPVDSFGGEIPKHPEYMIDLDEARGLLTSDTGELVSVRSWAEFIGTRSGYHYIDAKGRIPGAVFGNCGSDAYHMENYRNFDYTTRQYSEIERNWREEGITRDKHIAFYCGTGWRASEAFMNAYLMGWPKISVFDGGWYQWSAHPDLPFETGVPARPEPTPGSS